VSGYPGNSGNTNIYFHTAVELVDGADGKPAWTLNNGFSTDCTFIDRLCGGGTLKSTPSPSSTYVRQGFVVADASGFTGSLDIVGTQFTFGNTARKNDTSQSGTIYIDAGYSVTNSGSWSSPRLVVMGELVNLGTLSIPNSVVFSNDASLVVGELPADGVVLTSSAITGAQTLAVSVIGDAERAYAATVVDNQDGTFSLVVHSVLPDKVQVPVTIRHYGDDGWEDLATNFNFSTAWATNHYPSATSTNAIAAAYRSTAANGSPVWQCYMLGLNPTDATSQVSLEIAVSGAEINFSVVGLGETHPVDGIAVYWYLKTETDLSANPGFKNNRETAAGLAPKFSPHPMPDTPLPTTSTSPANEPSDRLFYKLTVSFVAE